MNVTVKTPKVVPPPVEIVIELSEREAQLLKLWLNGVQDGMPSDARTVKSALWYALDSNGVMMAPRGA